jgi:Fe-S-cluster formation regulator IscX/YfhJ
VINLLPRKVPVPKLKSDTKLITLLRSAIEASADESGWAHLGNVGTNLVTQAPDFDPRTYGFRKLNELVKAIGLFQIDARKSPTSPSQSIYIKDKRKKERE